ncbi:hypothetical protein [Halosegnis longus]|nr:hypothetical protein [Salella cibi]
MVARQRDPEARSRRIDRSKREGFGSSTLPAVASITNKITGWNR